MNNTSQPHPMPNMNHEITLIVAATTRHMGIGKAGGLPWTGLKQEMAYFARVTKRTSTVDAQAAERVGAGSDSLKPQRNAVIMGRKTWDSIPSRFKPLRERTNIVLSRSYRDTPALPLIDTSSEPLKTSSLEEAITALATAKETGKIFVIGGADVYRSALGHPSTKRILLTRVLTDFDCDTYFPVVLGDVGKWKKCSREELASFTGEDLDVIGRDGAEEKDENGTRYVFEMYERD